MYYPKSLDINVRDKNNLTNLGNKYLVVIKIVTVRITKVKVTSFKK